MLAKIYRLTKDKEYDYVFKNGRSSYDKIIGIKAVANKLENNRFGILVSAKVSKKAVERNKIKRQIREILKIHLSEIRPGFDVAVVVLPGILGRKYQEIEQSIMINIKRLKLYIG